jgi:carbon monoxide dehydrogenase subunit G
MKITNEFTVHTPVERAWAVLTDLEGIAPCLPGAQLTGVEGDTYSGKVKVKVGPVVSDFAGTARFVEKDDEARRAVIDAKGRDSRSAGNASAVVTARLRADGDRTLVNVDTDLKISGKLAQFGSGMIKEVSGKLLGQFVTNLEAKLAAEPSATATPGSTPTALAADESGAAERDAAPASAGTVTAGTPAAPGAAEFPANAFDVATSASSVKGTAAHVLPAQDTSPPTGESGGREVPGKAGTKVKAVGVREDAEEPEALDLLALAGGSVYKRAIPLGIGVVVVAAVIVWFVARR